MDYKDIRYEASEGIGLLTFTRNDRRNTLTDTRVIDEVEHALCRVSRDGVRVLIITGEGQAFSAGGNIKGAKSRSENDAPVELRRFYIDGIHRIVKAVHCLDIPVIAAVNGPAIGAGFDLVLYCDVAIASTKARFSEQFVNLGLIPGDGGMWIMQRKLGWQVAAELGFTGRNVAAEEAKTLGIVREIVEPEALLTRAHELAAQIACRPPVAVRYIKLLLRQGAEQNLDEHLDHCAALQALCQKTEDHAAAVRAIIEHDPVTPIFKGQ